MPSRRALLGIGLLGAGVAMIWGLRRRRRIGPAPRESICEVREEPVPVEVPAPLGDRVPLATVRGVVERAVPCWHAPKVTNFLHALRLWGGCEKFDPRHLPRPFEEPLVDPQELRSILLDDSAYRRRYPGEDSLLQPSEHGVLVRNDERHAGQFLGFPAHTDDLVAACAEAGLPAETRVVTHAGQGTVADLISDRLERASLPGGGWAGRWETQRAEYLWPSAGAQEAEVLLATGHHLEWASLVPTWLRPSENTLLAAIGKCESILRGWNRMDVSENYPNVSHFARAVVLLHGTSIDDVLPCTTLDR